MSIPFANSDSAETADTSLTSAGGEERIVTSSKIQEERKEPSTVRTQTEKPSSLKKRIAVFILCRVVIGIFIGIAVYAKRFKENQRKAFEVLGTLHEPVSITQETFDAARSGLIEDITKWNSFYGLADKSPDALNATIASGGAPWRDGIITNALDRINKKEYEGVLPNITWKIKTAREFYLNNLIKPILDQADNSPVVVAKDNINKILSLMEQKFGVELVDLKAALETLDGGKFVNLEDTEAMTQPLQTVLDQNTEHEEYALGKYFVANVGNALKKLVVFNNIALVFRTKLEEYIKKINQSDVDQAVDISEVEARL